MSMESGVAATEPEMVQAADPEGVQNTPCRGAAETMPEPPPWGFIREDRNPVLHGWGGYYRLAEVKGHFEEIDTWVRRKPRCSQWRQWKRGRTRRKEPANAGVGSRACEGQCVQRKGALVESRGLVHERSPLRKVAPPAQPGLPARNQPTQAGSVQTLNTNS